MAVGALHTGARPDSSGGDGIAEKDRPGAGAAAGYANICRPCVVATVDRLERPGRRKVILCRGADRRAERRLEGRRALFYLEVSHDDR